MGLNLLNVKFVVKNLRISMAWPDMFKFIQSWSHLFADIVNTLVKLKTICTNTWKTYIMSEILILYNFLNIRIYELAFFYKKSRISNLYFHSSLSNLGLKLSQKRKTRQHQSHFFLAITVHSQPLKNTYTNISNNVIMKLFNLYNFFEH